MTIQVAAAIFAGVLSAAPIAFAADLEAGAKVFDGNCAACHAGGKTKGSEKTLRKKDLVEHLRGGFKPESIVNQVTIGLNNMPAFKGQLNAVEISNVAAYVYDQATGDKWVD